MVIVIYDTDSSSHNASEPQLCGYFDGMEMIGWQGGCHRTSHIAPLFFNSPAVLKGPPINPPYFSTTSSHAKQLGQNIMTETTHTQFINFRDSNSTYREIIGGYDAHKPNGDERITDIEP